MLKLFMLSHYVVPVIGINYSISLKKTLCDEFQDDYINGEWLKKRKSQLTETN